METRIILLIVTFILCFDIALGLENDTIWSKQFDPGHLFVVKFSPDGQYVFASLDENIIQIDAETGATIKTFLGHFNNVRRIDFSPTGDTLISSGYDATVRLWDVKTGDSIYTIPITGNYSRGTEAVITNDGKRILTQTGFTSEKPDLHIYDINSKEMIKEIDNYSLTYHLALSRDGKYFSIAEWYNVLLFDQTTYEELDTSIIHNGEVLDIKFSPDSKMLASCSKDGTVILWDVENRTVLKTLNFNDTPYEKINNIVFSNDSKYIVLGSESEDAKYNVIQVWDYANEKMIYEYLYSAAGYLDINNNDFLVSSGIEYTENHQYWDFIYLLYPKWKETGIVIPLDEGFSYTIDNEKLRINFEDALPVIPLINIYTLNGKKVPTNNDITFQSSGKYLEIDIGHLSPGLYIIEISSLGKLYTLKIVKG